MFEFLKGLFLSSAAADSDKLGSNADPIRQLLFASQSLREQARLVSLDEASGPLQFMADARQLAEEGKLSEAASALRSILQSPKLETRIQLFAWSGLRELGEKPEGRLAYEVLGVVVEVPQEGAYDTLAAYVDGSARYLNFSGKAVFWDAPDPAIKRLCQALVDSTIPASGKAKERTSLALPRRGVQATMLTRSGPYVIANPPQTVLAAGAALMLELMRRAQQGKSRVE